MRIAILTGNELRHQYFVNQLIPQFDTVLVFFEKKANVHETWDLSVDDRAMMDRHFQSRQESEKHFFGSGEFDFNDSAACIEIEHGAINNDENIARINAFDPDLILLYGSSIIKAPLLSRYERRIINLHLGLSPYYRGSGTNFWPFYYDELPCIGATIHLAVPEVDAGNILCQVRPEIDATDGIHDFGNKTIIAALKIIPEALTAYNKGEIELRTQDLVKGRVFKRKDFTTEAIKIARENIEKGIVKQYFENYVEENKKYPIVELNRKPGK